MPEFVNPKYSDGARAAFSSPTRLECMMQDYAWLLPHGAKVGPNPARTRTPNPNPSPNPSPNPNPNPILTLTPTLTLMPHLEPEIGGLVTIVRQHLPRLQQ